MHTAKNNIINLLRELRANGILSQELHGKLNGYLQKIHVEDGNAAVEQRINDLLPLRDMTKSSEGYDESQIQCLSRNLLRAMELENYTIVEVLVKIKLIYIRLLNSKRQITKANVLFYQDEPFDKLLPSIEDERQEFLNELINAPIDDIATYLDKKNFSFKDFYTTYALDKLVDYITQPTLNNSYDQRKILDHVRALFQGSLPSRYAPLTASDLITQINEQFHSNRSYRYRLLLETFVKTQPRPKFTLDSFYALSGIQSILSEKQKQQWATLFEIYCLKLLNADQKMKDPPQSIFSHSTPQQRNYQPNKNDRRNNTQRSNQKSRYNGQSSSKSSNSPATRRNNLELTSAKFSSASKCLSGKPFQSSVNPSILAK